MLQMGFTSGNCQNPDSNRKVYEAPPLPTIVLVIQQTRSHFLCIVISEGGGCCDFHLYTRKLAEGKKDLPRVEEEVLGCPAQVWLVPEIPGL